jgi:hypothetical protein
VQEDLVSGVRAGAVNVFYGSELPSSRPGAAAALSSGSGDLSWRNTLTLSTKWNRGQGGLTAYLHGFEVAKSALRNEHTLAQSLRVGGTVNRRLEPRGKNQFRLCDLAPWDLAVRIPDALICYPPTVILCPATTRTLRLLAFRLITYEPGMRSSAVFVKADASDLPFSS